MGVRDRMPDPYFRCLKGEPSPKRKLGRAKRPDLSPAAVKRLEREHRRRRDITVVPGLGHAQELVFRGLKRAQGRAGEIGQIVKGRRESGIGRIRFRHSGACRKRDACKKNMSHAYPSLLQI